MVSANCEAQSSLESVDPRVVVLEDSVAGRTAEMAALLYDY